METFYAAIQKLYLHEIFSGNKSFCAQGVNQSADMLFIFIRPLQGTQDNLAQQFWQEMSRSLHLSHTIDCILHILTLQVFRY